MSEFDDVSLPSGNCAQFILYHADFVSFECANGQEYSNKKGGRKCRFLQTPAENLSCNTTDYLPMKEHSLQIALQIYDTTEELAAADATLLQHAKAALVKSYSPYSKFQVGAAVRLANGAILSGANQENASYPMCLCAEQVTLATAASQYPGVAIEAIAITVHSGLKDITQPASPCGACRQVLCETELRHHQPIRMILQGASGPVFILKKASDLMPLSFDGSFLE